MCLGHEKVMEFQIDPTILDKKKKNWILNLCQASRLPGHFALFSPVCLTNFFLCQ